VLGPRSALGNHHEHHASLLIDTAPSELAEFHFHHALLQDLHLMLMHLVHVMMIYLHFFHEIPYG